jgi:predicted esterase
MTRSHCTAQAGFAAVLVVGAAACLTISSGVAASEPPPAQAGQEGIFLLPGALPQDLPHGPMFDHDLKWHEEKFYLFIPPNYRGREPFGLIAFIHAGDQMGVPKDWKNVLARNKLLYVAPQGVGNNQPVPRRALLAVAAISKMMELYEVDPRRVFVTGHSGGAKVACLVAFTQPELISGALPICGVAFPPDGDADKELLKKAKSQVGFALITGSKDFSHDSIAAYYNDLAAEKFRVKLFDVPNMPHQIARGPTLNAALNWLEGRDEPPHTDGQSKPGKSKKP